MNRAVPILLVSFGLTSELWWQRHSGRALPVASDWYASRLRRLLPPSALLGLTWCVAAQHWSRWPESRGVVATLLAMFGYLPWAGTSWFIVTILQLVLVFPALDWIRRHASPWVALSLAAGITSLCNLHVWDIVRWGSALFGTNVPQPGFYYAWVFFPRVLWPVAAGMALAHSWTRLRWPATLVAVALVVAEPAFLAWVGEPASAAFVGPLYRTTLMQLMDVPLAIAVFGIVQGVRLPEFLAWPLERVGRASWGIYLGHAALFEIVHLAGAAPELDPSQRWGYASVLLVFGAAAAWAGNLARTTTRGFRLRYGVS